MNESLLINEIPTPNPSLMKFHIEGFLISPDLLIEFNKNSSQYHGISSKVADALLEKDFINSVIFGYDFISIIKTDHVNWYEISSDIIFTIIQYEDDIRSNRIFTISSKDDSAFNEDVECDASDMDTVNTIKEFLDDVIRPKIAMDGGDLQLKAYKNQVAYLQLRGAGISSPSSMQTSYNYIRETLIANIPYVIDIEQV